MGDGGLMIESVTPNSPAFIAGVRAGDLILGIDQKAIRTPDDVTSYISKLEPGKDVRWILQRDGRPLRVVTRVRAWSDLHGTGDQRRMVYSPPNESSGDAQMAISEIRAELLSLRDEVRRLRDAIKSVPPQEKTKSKGTQVEPSGNQASELPPLP
ncbi:MAG: PDZ domain-containing protein [Planctomycetes bacterium]|nr:PDZ domain-containing protein [Planctomycetota bacterium]